MSPYQSTLESVSTHSVPEWYEDAKLGIFVHYGLFSVPAWAVVSEGDIIQTITKLGWEGHFRANPYAEWYLNTLRIPGSPTQEFHRSTYGQNFSYDDFVPRFNEANARWDPNAWADLFARVGARYVVLTSKHCESFLLWPSAHPNPFKKDYTARRDIVGELSGAVRARGMRMGLYYCGGFDWCFNTRPITTASDLAFSVPQSQAYVDYCTDHWHELIDRYQPSVLWGDVGYPHRADVPALFAHYYNAVPEGVVNDRFFQFKPGIWKTIARLPGLRGWFEKAMTKVFMTSEHNPAHADFTTPEYSSYKDVVPKKWETCRGLGYSFGYNRNETAAQMLSVEALVHLLVDIVSKNGNLLLNVGPAADGTISDLQVDRLEGLGAWLAVNGEAIFGTRPWKRAEGQTREGLGVRFTQKAGSLYAILLGTPAGLSVTFSGLQAVPGMQACLPDGTALECRQDSDGLTVTFPAPVPVAPALAIRFSPAAV